LIEFYGVFMLVRKLEDCREFVSGDEALLREILHPDGSDLSIGYSLAHAVVEPGKITRPHRLQTSEVYYILAGNGVMYVDDDHAPVVPGTSVYIPPGAKQNIENTGDTDLVFLCIVDPAWKAADEEIL